MGLSDTVPSAFQTIWPFLSLILPVAAGYVVWAIGNRKVGKERADRQAEMEAQLRIVRLESEIAEARRQEQRHMEAETLRRDAAAANKVLADTLEKKAQEDREAVAKQNSLLADLAVVSDKTHDLSNSAKVAADVTVVELRNQLEAAKVAAATLKETHAFALQAAKDLAARDLGAAREENTRLSEQLKAALAQIPASPTIPTPTVTLPLLPDQQRRRSTDVSQGSTS